MKLTYQLYSSRNHPPLEDTAKMLAANGYAAVQGFAHFFEKPRGEAGDPAGGGP